MNYFLEEIPWYVFKKLPTIINLPLNEQTRRYQEYMLQIFNQRQSILLEQYLQQQQTINSNSGGASSSSPTVNNALLLEDSSYLLQEDSSNILLE